MEDVFNFANNFYEEGGLDPKKLIPEFRIKLREELCFKGRKIPYADFTKCVKRDNTYTPLVCLPASSVKEDDIVLDLHPLLSAGVAEMLALLSHQEDFTDMQWLEWCAELEFAKDWFTMLDQIDESFRADESVDTVSPTLALSETLRTSIVDYRFVTIRRIYAQLNALHAVNPKSYCIALIEAMKVAYSGISLFMNPIAVFCHDSRREISSLQQRWENLTKERLSRFGAIEYNVNNSGRIRRISDGRGLSISMLGMFLYDFFNKFGDFAGVAPVVPIRKRESREGLEQVFEACLGDDYVGRLLSNGKCRIMPCDNDMVMIGSEANFLAIDCQHRAELDGMEIGRGFAEGHMLWKHAVGIKEMEPTGILPPVDVTYGTRSDFIHACIDFVFSRRGIKLSSNLLNSKRDELVDAIMERVDADATLEKYKTSLENTTNATLARARDVLKRKDMEVTELRGSLEYTRLMVAEKQHIIDELRKEVSSLRSKVKSTYSVDSEVEAEEELTETSVSNSEMLDFVNQFRLVFIGGKNIMEQRLHDAGFTNVYFLDSERAGNSTLVYGDFFCICTKFVSHKLVYNAETNYKDQLDSFFYFNGTNADAFLRVCYHFMHEWFKSEGGDSDA